MGATRTTVNATPAFDDQVFARVEVDALLGARAKRAQAGGLNCLEALRLARPVHPVAFAPHIHGLAQSQLQPLEVDLPTFRTDFGKQFQKLQPLLFSDVLGTKVEFFRLLRC